MASPVITPLEGGLFAVLAVMVLIWFVGVNKLSRRLRERHSDKFDEMGLARLWPQNLMQWLSGYNNSGPVFALFRFLARLFVLAVTVYLLLVICKADVFGLLLGLSVLVFNIMSLSFYMISAKGD